jgi:hypothetical protein
MGKDSRGIEASSGGVSENYELGSCEAHLVSVSPPKDCSGAASTVGAGQGGAEEGGVGRGQLCTTI